MDGSKDDRDQGWLPEVEELRLRESLASQMGGQENLARHRAAGRLNVRERIERLLDRGSFHETGAITGIPAFEGDRLVKLFPSNFIMGTGKIDNRKVVVGADDFTIRGGAADAAIGRKAPYAERMALDLRLPMIRLVDGTGGGGSVKYLEKMDRTYIPANPAMEVMEPLLSTVPVISAALGSVAGLGAARVVFSQALGKIFKVHTFPHFSPYPQKPKISAIIPHISIHGTLSFPRGSIHSYKASQSFAAHLSENFGLIIATAKTINNTPQIIHQICLNIDIR